MTYIIYILCLYEKFELILIKIEFLKVAQKLGQRPCTIAHCLWPNFTENDYERILHFYNFS